MSSGKKLSKSDSGDKLEARNKSYEKVLDLEIAFIKTHREEGPEAARELHVKWALKAIWHETEHGW